MLLGGVACLMIIAGLFLFTGNEGQRSPAARVNDGYRTVETIPLSTSSSIDSTADLSADLNTQTNTISTSQSISQPSAQLELVTDAPSTLSNNLTPTAAAALTAANEPADSDFLADEGAEDENSIIVSIESDTAADSGDAINDNAFAEVPATEDSEETITDTLVAEVVEEVAATDDNSDQLAAEATVETIEPTTAAAAPQAAPEPQPEPALEPEPAPASNAATVVASNSATQQPAAAPSTPGNVLESPTWILVQDPKRFTVQMSASTDRASVESFLIRNDLPETVRPGSLSFMVCMTTSTVPEPRCGKCPKLLCEINPGFDALAKFRQR